MFPAALIVAIVLPGCASADNGEGTTAGGNSTASPSGVSPSSPPTESGAPTSGSTPIILEFGGQNVSGELDSGTTAASLIAQLPLTLSFRDYGGQEKVAELPVGLDLTGAPGQSNAETATIGYYVPDQRLVLYYSDVGTYPGIVPIGTYDAPETVENQTDDFTVTIRSAD